MSLPFPITHRVQLDAEVIHLAQLALHGKQEAPLLKYPSMQVTHVVKLVQVKHWIGHAIRII
jgi:hypothetical protein